MHHRSYQKNKHKWAKTIAQYKERNRQAILEYRREFKRKNREKWMGLLKDLGLTSCVRCGYSRCFAALDFHHPNPTDKRFPQMGYIFQEKITERRLEELAKCIVLCANCHREEHHGDLNGG